MVVVVVVVVRMIMDGERHWDSWGPEMGCTALCCYYLLCCTHAGTVVCVCARATIAPVRFSNW